MVKIATKPLNMLQKLRNMSTVQGRIVNQFAQSMSKNGYRNFYQRELNYDRVILTGKKKSGTTKTYIFSSGSYSRKVNRKVQVDKNTQIRIIDKSFKNANGREISGINKFQKLVNNVITSMKVVKRGWSLLK